MRAIILAAGSCRRMRPLTETTHKTLLEVGGETVLSRIILNLLNVDITRITVVTGYRADDLREHLESRFPRQAFQYVHNSDYNTTNNLFSLHLAMAAIEIDSDIILIESDLVFGPDVLRRLLASPHPNVALVDRHRAGMDGTVVTLDGDVITGIIPPHLQGAHFSFQDKFKTLNIYKFSRSFCTETFRGLLAFYATTLTNKSYYELILGIVIYLHAARIHAELVGEESWCEIDDPNDLEIARYALVPSARLDVLRRGCGGYWNYNVLDFCYLANAHFPSPSVWSELTNSFKAVIGQYGSSQEVLDAKMSYFQFCPADRIVALNGLSQIYPWLAEWHRGRRALIPAPTFGEYARAFPGALTYKDTLEGFDEAEIEKKIPQSEVICFINPNNPTGSLLRSSWIFGLARRYADKTFFVDESFIDFSGEPSLLGSLAQEPLPNVVVLKSLGKSLGVPGLRLGCAYSSNLDFIRRLRAVLPIWNLNALAENYLEIILKHQGEIAASYELNRQERDFLRTELARLSFVEKVSDSRGNFLLARFRCEPGQMETKLKTLVTERGIYVKDCTEKFGGQAALARVGVRRREDNERLLEGMRHIFSTR